MAGMNSVHLVGRVGMDPEYRKFTNGGSMISFSLATSETWRDKTSGEKKEKTQWHRVVINSDAVVEIARKYVNKGDMVGIEGAIEYRQWEKDGQKHTTAEIVLGVSGRLHLLGSAGGNGERGGGDRGGNGGGGYDRGGDDDRGSRGGSGRSSGGSSKQEAFSRDMDDDIPF